MPSAPATLNAPMTAPRSAVGASLPISVVEPINAAICPSPRIMKKPRLALSSGLSTNSRLM